MFTLKKKLVSLAICSMMLSLPVSAFAADEIVDTNNTIITTQPGSVIDTGEVSNGNGKSMITPHAVSDYYYYSDPDPVSTSDSGKLYSHAERQRYGDLSGKVRTFRYYIYSKYEGNATVEKISSEWYTTAKLRSSATLTLNTSLGTSGSSISAGVSSTWQNVTTPTKTWTNSNGSKTTYEQSNFAISPDSDLSGYEVSIVHTSKVKLKGDAKTYSLSSGV
ncbi:hypothetical protein [Paenibacillus pabuli]|uniref:hypothetical protein n=1 Tax=Paenibacillus pabuli TaxID=1472 RepID=UPI001FFF39C0|nr:hypothetical protein [Paenibacillus pabuli]UPK44964.1 hypothetical protein KET34_05510 [Paenibacillus pabuli]